MDNQNYKNHIRLVPMFHFVGYPLLLSLLIGAIINLVHSAPENLYSASLLLLVAVLIGLLFWYSRSFALKAQDRAIRAEENLRHFALTGKLLDSRLRLGQIIALRFASDEEFVALAQRAAAEGLAPKAIKQAVKNWRGDMHRV